MRAKKQPKPENHERWLITYADLITLLLVFFIVLYSGSQDDAKKFAILAGSLHDAFNVLGDGNGTGGSSAVFTGSGSTNAGGSTQEISDFQALQGVIQQISKERGLGDRLNIRMEQDRIIIGMGSDLLFASGSAQLRPSALPIIDAVAQALKGNPNEIRIDGHTDNVPHNSVDYASNWELSSARATAVLRRLVEGGLDAGKMFAAAFGESRPRADNSTAEGRAQNRRAEVVVIYPPATPDPAAGVRTPRATPTPKPAKGH